MSTNWYHVFYAFPSADQRIAAQGRYIGSGVDTSTLLTVAVWRYEVQRQHLLDFRRQIDACTDIVFVDRVSGDELRDNPTFARWHLVHPDYRLPRAVHEQRGTGGYRWTNEAHAVLHFPQWPGSGWAPGIERDRIRGGRVYAYHPGTQWGRWANDLLATFAGWDAERRIKLPLVEDLLNEHPGAEIVGWDWAESDKSAFMATMELKPGQQVRAVVANRPLQRRQPLIMRDPLGIIDAEMSAYLEEDEGA